MNGQTKTLFDVSVLVDALKNDREPMHASATVLTLAARGNIKGYLSAAAIECLNDTLTRSHGSPSARRKIMELRDLLAVATVDAAVIDAAMGLDWKYLDDALTHECARINGLESVITLNPSDFSNPALSVLSPSDFLRQHHV